MSEDDGDQFDLTREPESGGQLLSFGAGRARRRARPQGTNGSPETPGETRNLAASPDSYGLPNQERWVDRISTSTPPLNSTGLKMREPSTSQGAVAAISSPLAHTRPPTRRTPIHIPELSLPAIRFARPSRRLVIAAAVLAITAAVVGGVLSTLDGSHSKTGVNAASLGASSPSFGLGADPRATEHPALLAPVSRAAGRAGRAAQFAQALIVRPDHHHHAPAVVVVSSSTSSTYQPAETETTPESTYTAPTTTQAPVETTPTAPTGGGGSSSGGSSTSGGGSSANSSGSKTPAFGPGGSLGPGSSPDS